jgi:hypothetical protein
MVCLGSSAQWPSRGAIVVTRSPQACFIAAKMRRWSSIMVLVPGRVPLGHGIQYPFLQPINQYAVLGRRPQPRTLDRARPDTTSRSDGTAVNPHTRKCRMASSAPGYNPLAKRIIRQKRSHQQHSREADRFETVALHCPRTPPRLTTLRGSPSIGRGLRFRTRARDGAQRLSGRRSLSSSVLSPSRSTTTLSGDVTRSARRARGCASLRPP